MEDSLPIITTFNSLFDIDFIGTKLRGYQASQLGSQVGPANTVYVYILVIDIFTYSFIRRLSKLQLQRKTRRMKIEDRHDKGRRLTLWLHLLFFMFTIGELHELIEVV